MNVKLKFKRSMFGVYEMVNKNKRGELDKSIKIIIMIALLYTNAIQSYFGFKR